MWQMRVLLAELFVCQQKKIRFSRFLFCPQSKLGSRTLLDFDEILPDTHCQFWVFLLTFCFMSCQKSVQRIFSWNKCANNLIFFSLKLFSLKRSCECFYRKKRMKTSTHHLPVIMKYTKGKASSFIRSEFQCYLKFRLQKMN